MGSRDTEIDNAKDEVRVLVTGFGVRSPLPHEIHDNETKRL